MSSEFCPKCYYPLDDSDDDGRLCGTCKWFGDKSEVETTPPTSADLELAFVQMLSLYRDVCRLELLAERVAEQYPKYQSKLNVIKARVSQARHSLLYIFRNR